MTTVTSVFVDWITCVGMKEQFEGWIAKHLTDITYNMSSPGYGHPVSVVYKTYPIRRYWSPGNLEKENVFVISGEAMAMIYRDYPPHIVSRILQDLAANCSHFTRVDLTVDIMDSGELNHWLVSESENGEIDFGRRKVTTIRHGNAHIGETLYVGSRTSPVMLRCYDKNFESDGKIQSSRIEFELKGWFAKAIHQRFLINEPQLSATHIFNYLLRDFFPYMPAEELSNIYDGEVEVIERPAYEPMLDKKDWLKKQVMPTFWKDYDETGGDLLTWFLANLGIKPKQ